MLYNSEFTLLTCWTFVGGLAASLASIQQMPVAPSPPSQVTTIKNVSRHCQMLSGRATHFTLPAETTEVDIGLHQHGHGWT